MKVLRLDTLDGRRKRGGLRGPAGRDDAFYLSWSTDPLWGELNKRLTQAQDAAKAGEISDAMAADIWESGNQLIERYYTLASDGETLETGSEALGQWKAQASKLYSEAQTYVKALREVLPHARGRRGTRLAILGLGMATVLGGLAAAVVYGERRMG